MKVLRYAARMAGVMLLAHAAHVWAGDTDHDKLQGKWIVESFEYNGNAVEMMKDAVREFKDAKYTLSPTVGDVIEGTVKLDSSQKPKTIDLQINDRTLKGIYEVEGDGLKMCYSLSNSERPTEFVSKPDSGIIVVIHRRMK